MLEEEQLAHADRALWFGLFPAYEPALDFLHQLSSLDKSVAYPHVTFGYKVPVPDGIAWDDIYWIDAIGYGNDGANEGLLVSVPEELEMFYFGAETPHVTLSTSQDGAPVDTAFLNFTALPQPFSIPMKFGYYAQGKYYI